MWLLANPSLHFVHLTKQLNLNKFNKNVLFFLGQTDAPGQSLVI